MKRINDILVDEIDYPTIDDLTNMQDDTAYNYVNYGLCTSLANIGQNVSAYMIARYCLEDNFDTPDTAIFEDDNSFLKPYFDNIKYMDSISDNDWYHTKYGEFADDDVILTLEGEKNYYMIWLDNDVSDCIIFKINKTHYETINEFNDAVVDYVQNDVCYKIKPIRKPCGWLSWK